MGQERGSCGPGEAALWVRGGSAVGQGSTVTGSGEDRNRVTAGPGHGWTGCSPAPCCRRCSCQHDGKVGQHLTLSAPACRRRPWQSAGGLLTAAFPRPGGGRLFSPRHELGSQPPGSGRLTVAWQLGLARTGDGTTAGSANLDERQQYSTAHNSTGQGATVQDKTVNNSTVQYRGLRTAQDRTEQYKTRQDRTEQNKIGQGQGQDRPEQDGERQYDILYRSHYCAPRQTCPGISQDEQSTHICGSLGSG